ncbi:hypothetical protein ACXR0O_25410 [Verrucomicrobiota bacterium sgz303538]
MNDLVTNISFGAFIVSTTVFLRRAGYSWLAAGLAALFSPLAFIVLYAILGLILSLLAGKLHIPERVLPQNAISLFAAFVVVAGLCIGGFHLSRRTPHQQPPQTPD